MKRTLVFVSSALALGLFGPAHGDLSSPVSIKAHAQAIAIEQTAIFAVENMTCALCPVTVKKAMEGVPGVQSVQIDFEGKTATVVFDPSVTSPEAIAAASTSAGYPAAQNS
jgi:mercuric ion binding protein